MQDLERAILATLGYYQAFELPLTSQEIFNFLIQPARVMSAPAGGMVNSDCSMGAILHTIKQLQTRKLIWQHNGYYALASVSREWYEQRIEREKVAAQKWRRVERLVRYLRWVPFARMILVSGSLSLDAADRDSDYDLIVVTAPKRVALGRLAMLLAAQLLGVRRTRHDRIAPDKLCFNHFISEEQLTMAHQSLYTAQTYARATLVLDRNNTARRWIVANTWIRQWVRNWSTLSISTRRTISTQPVIELAVATSERVCVWLGGDYLEQAVLALQAWRAKRHQLTTAGHAQAPGRVTITAQEMEFHPRSIEATVLANYQATLHNLGITPSQKELDSGLV